MERAFIQWLRQQVAGAVTVPVGIGDDAAVVECAVDGRVVVTTDMLMDGVDFHLDQCDPARVGRKALAVNLSDLAAMAARPMAAFVSVALPRQGGLQLAQSLYSGLLPLARQFDLPVAGGDTNTWDGPLVISVTALGGVTGRGPLLRQGARPGDAIVVTGAFGGSILGRHLEFTPRVREACLLHQLFELRAGMDVSDGLSLDLSRLAEACGCGAELDLSAIPISPDAHALAEQAGDGRSPLDHALGDGEDFELILALAPDEADRMVREHPLAIGVHRIGQLVAEPGLWSVDSTGRRTPLTPRGYEHHGEP